MKKITSLMILIALSFNFLLPIISIATDENGTEELIMYISNEEELWNFAKRVNEGEGLSGYTIKLTNDINLNCNESKQWTPIGKNYNTQFKGTFDGQNFTISGLYISSVEDTYAGLFGYASNINNLIVKDSSIIQDTNVSRYIGIIAGQADLKNCKTVNCTIRLSNILHSDSYNIGGIVGRIRNSIYRCNNETDITVEDVKSDLVFSYIGGIVGNASHEIVKKCSNKGNISIDTFACSTGGIVGDGYMKLENCYNSGNITALGSARYNATGTGGIIGSNHGTINKCYNLGNISGYATYGYSTVGGISGVNFSNTNSVTNCYNMGIIKAVNSSNGSVSVGGITGRNGGRPVGDDGALIENCYNIGIVSKENQNSIVGNLVGINEENGILNNCYYLDNTNNSIAKNESTKEISAVAKNSEDMKNSTFVNMLNNNIDVFKIDEYNLNKGYPILVWAMSMEIEKEPDKLAYRQNIEDLDLSGGKIKLKYNYSEYNTTIDMNSDMISVSGFSNTEEGIVKLKVLYTDEYEDEFEEEFEVEIVESIPPELSVSYSTTQMTNKDVTATIKANEEVQALSGWTLATDKKSMTKVYSSNTDAPEEVIVKDLVGNETKISVSVTNIDKIAPIGKVTYSTTKPTNKDVTATITVNEAIQQVEGWTISSDLTTLSKTFTINDEETVIIKDLAGNESPIKIVVNNMDKEEIHVLVDYSTTLLTNQNVDVTVTLNKKVKAVSGWTTSQDGKVLSKTFEQNGEEKLTIYDEVGNSKNVTVSVNNIDKIKPETDIKYSITELTNQDVIVIVTANESIQQVEGWTLRER